MEKKLLALPPRPGLLGQPTLGQRENHCNLTAFYCNFAAILAIFSAVGGLQSPPSSLTGLVRNLMHILFYGGQARLLLLWIVHRMQSCMSLLPSSTTKR